MALDATVGGASANSYATVDEASAYHEGRLHADAWTDADSADQEKALQMATQTLDDLIDWHGVVVTDTQRLGWPRAGVIGRNGRLIEQDELPRELVEATAEFARQLLDENRTADSDVETQGLTALEVGPVKLSFKDEVIAKVVPDAVFYKLRHLGALINRGSGSAKIVRT